MTPTRPTFAVTALGTLLPYIIGAATTLAVQLVIQLYVVPRVETRKRREDRWERNVVELAELLATDVVNSASDAKVAQMACHDLQEMAADPRIDHTKIEGRLPELQSLVQSGPSSARPPDLLGVN